MKHTNLTKPQHPISEDRYRFIAIIGAIIALAGLIGFAACGQGRIPETTVKYPEYISYWNPSTLIADSVIYIVRPHNKAAKRESGFHSTQGRDNLTKDYAHSGYDIGHMADAEDMSDNAIDEYNSFDFVNVFPQRPNLNRITWLALENYVRKLNVPVKIKVSYVGISDHLGKDGVAIPILCIKEIWYNGHYERYNMINNDTVNRHPFTFYRRFPKFMPKEPIL